MSATDTAVRVINWAMAPTPSLPRGDARLVDQLIHPPESVCQALGELTRLTAARLRWQMTPIPAAVGVGSIILAAAIGVAHIPELAGVVLQVVPEALSPVDWVARHGLLAPSLSFLPAEMAEDCRLLSPLTAVFNRPAADQESTALQAIDLLLQQPSPRNALIQKFAQPTSDTDVRVWRRGVLARLRLGTPAQQTFVLDVYEAMLIHHEAEAMAQIQRARGILTDPETARDDQLVREGVAIANWWEPLYAMDRSHRDQIRSRRYLSTSYLQGLQLYRMAQRLTGGTI